MRKKTNVHYKITTKAYKALKVKAKTLGIPACMLLDTILTRELVKDTKTATK